jgi:hypothetical protein
MFDIENNKKNKSAVILNLERSEWVSRSHVTSVESVVNDRAKTQCYSAKRDLYGLSLRSTLKMTTLALILSLNLSTALAADCETGEKLCGTDCIPQNKTCWSCGDNCGAYTTGLWGAYTLNISGTGAMNNYSSRSDVPWNSYNSYVRSINISEGITNIGDNAFNNYYLVNSAIEIPSTVTTIGNNAFRDMGLVTGLTIPDYVTSIGNYAFAGIHNVTGTLNIPSSVTSIGNGAFYDMTGVTGLTIPDSVTNIGAIAFNGTKITSATIPDSVTNLGLGAFSSTKVTSLAIPDSLTSIDDRLFSYAPLNELIIPDSWGDEGFIISDSLFQDTCFANSSRPSGCENPQIICQGDKTKCQSALSKFLSDGNACISNSRNCITSDIPIKSVDELTDKTDEQKAALCTGGRTDGMYKWENGSCQRISDATTCNSTTKYYFNTAANNGNGLCQRLPTTQTTCTGTDIEWDTINSKCLNKKAITSAPENNNQGSNQEEVVSGSVDEAACREQGKVFWGEECHDTYPFTKKRWTPAEANEWLHDGNDNFVIITFKK